MKSLTYIIIAIIVITSCSKRTQKVFTIDLPHYSSKIELDRLNNFDTLIVWNWYNDNMASHRSCYRIQNAELGIIMENGMAPAKAENFDQMTIKTPITPNKFPCWPISEWLNKNKENYLSDRPSDKIFILDSLTIDNKRFGVFGIKTMAVQTKVIYMTNINNEAIEFEFHTNLHPAANFYLKSLNMMKTIKIKPGSFNPPHQ